MELKTSDSSSAFVDYQPIEVVANTANIPLPFEQAISEVPSDLKVSVAPSILQLAKKDTPEIIRRNAIVANFTLNPPLKNDFLEISRLYKTIHQVVFNWDRQHETSFFESYPECVLLNQTEKTATSGVPSREWLRNNRKKLSKRLAHYYIIYRNHVLMLKAAAMNLLTLTRLNGTEYTKAISRDLRWSWINGRCNLYERFPAGVGDENYLITNTCYATGKTTFGADIVAFGLWKNDVYGSDGAKAFTPDFFYTYNQTTKTMIPSFNDDGYVNHKGDHIQEWLRNMAAIKQFYTPANDADPSRNAADRKTPKWWQILGVEATPSMPFIENGFAIHAENSSTYVSAQGGETDKRFIRYNAFGVSDNLSGRLWSNYEFWERTLTHFFSPMSDPNSDFRILAEQFGLFEKSSKIEDVLKAIRANKNWDIEDLAKRMVYRGGDAKSPITRTFFRFMPMIPYTKEDIDALDAASETVFTEYDWYFSHNFERFDVDSDNIVSIIESSKTVPTFTPYLAQCADANGDAIEPVLLNGFPGQGKLCKTGINDFDVMSGKYDVMLSYMKQTDYGLMENTVSGVGVTASVLDTALRNDGNLISFEEDPTVTFVRTMPLIDNSDPQQCGFRIMISNDDAYGNEWTNFFRNKTKATSGISKEFVGGAALDSGIELPVAPAFSRSEDAQTHVISWGRAHALNDAYLNKMKHIFVFLGGDIFNHPVSRYAHPTVDFPRGDFEPVDSAAYKQLIRTNFYSKYLDKTPGSGAIVGDYADKASPDEPDYYQFAYLVNNEWSGFQEIVSSAVKSVSSLNQIQKLMTGTDGNTYKLHYFDVDPAYGPVNIISSAPVVSKLSGFLPLFDNTSNPTEATDQRVSYDTVPIEYSKGGSLSVNQTISKMNLKYLHKWGYFKAMWTLWFFDSLHYRAVRCKDGFVSFAHSAALVVEFTTQSKWNIFLMARTLAQYLGLKSTVPFWSELPIINKDGSPSASGSMPENDIMAEPRIPRASGNNNSKPLATSSRKFSHTSESQSAQTYFSGKSKDVSPSPKSKESGRKGGRRGKGFKRDKTKSFEAPSDIKISEDGVKDSRPSFDSKKVVKQNSDFDTSSDKQDKDALGKLKTPASPAEAMTIVN